ncbi:hypothetical protein M0R72_12390 [Candidatus Pacearchaeota archaeon]|jgi:hypothetical protein|nr:hypothetical protein [Candidatus Pacearchaeota archaeon]
MRELLEELKQLDPACYEDIRRRVIYAMDEDFKLYVTNQTFRENVDDVIQGCVQRACDVRGWYYSVGIDGNDSDQATGKRLPGACIWDNENLDETWAADTPAGAILTAYITARRGRP